MNSNIRDFIKAIQNANKTATSAYDTAARVTRVEGSTAWVHVEGGVEETPVEMSISCEPGDDVRVRINKGAAYIIGNNTNPPTNDKAAVQQVINISQIARQTATKAYEYLQSLFDELSKYVAKGTSNIGILSEVMKKTEDGVEIYKNDTDNNVYVQIHDSDVDVIQKAGNRSQKIFKAGVNNNQPFISAFSNDNTNPGIYSSAIGYGAVASGYNAHAEGAGIASEAFSHAEGNGKASGVASHAEASGIASAAFSHAEGNGSLTGYDGTAMHAEGNDTRSYGYASHSEGSDAKSYGFASHSEGFQTVSVGESAHSEGYASKAFGVRSHAEGFQTTTGEGQLVTTSRSYVGDGTQKIFYSQTAEVTAVKINGSTASNYTRSGTKITFNTPPDNGDSIVIESTMYVSTGYKGQFAHAEGHGSTATGDASHAEGFLTTASGDCSHAEGQGTTASGDFSHASGLNTTAGYRYQTVVGQSNVNMADTIFEVGNGGVNNVFDVTTDGFIRTGRGYTAIAFGIDPDPTKNDYGYFIKNGNSYTFVPWITQDTTYTAGANIVISNNNVISAPNVAPIVNGKVPEQYLPSYVDDVIEGYYNSTDGKFYEESTYQTEIAGERGKIYISLDTDKSYRWSGTVFVELTSGGVVYSAGSGIDISATNEISADNTIARMTDLSGYLPLAGGTMTGAINSQHIVPATDDSYRLGSSSSKYNSAYVKRIYNLASIESTTDGSKRLLVPAKSGTIAVNEDLPNVVGNLIAINPVLTSGVLIANATVSGVSKNIYSPIPDWAQTVSTEPDYIKNKPAIPSYTSDLTNDSGFITINDIPPVPSHTSDLTNDSGFITINDIPTIPDELADLSDDSTHRLVTDTEKSTWNGKSDFSGSYNDLSDKPTIPAAQVNSDWNASSGVARILNKPTLATVATSGSYNDLSNKPTIPSVGNGTLTIQKNGTNVQTFTANQSGNATANIVVPFDYNATTVGNDDQGFKGAPHYGTFNSSSSVGALMGDDGVYMFLPYQTNSLSYGFVLACNDDGNQFYLGSLTGDDDDDAINWTRIYHDDYHPLAGKADFIKFPRNVVDYNTAMRSRAAETVAFDELSGTTGKPSYISTFTNPWFNLITMHSADSNYGSQLAIPMTGFTAPAWRYYAGGNFGSWEYIPSADALSVGNSSTPVYLENGKLKAGSALPDVSTKVSKSGDTMTGTLILSKTTDASGTANNKPALIVGGTDTQAHLELDGNEIIAKANGTTGSTLSLNYDGGGEVDIGNSTGGVYARGNMTIDSISGNYSEGLRINSTPNDANGFALITMGTQSGTKIGVSNSYPTYQIGKWNDGNFYMGFRSTSTGNDENFLRYLPTSNGGGAAGTLRIGTRNYINTSSDTRVLCHKNLITESSSGGKALLLLFVQARTSTAYNVRLYRIYNGNVSYVSLGSSGSSLGTVSVSGDDLIFTSSVAGVEVYPLFIGAN